MASQTLAQPAARAPSPRDLPLRLPLAAAAGLGLAAAGGAVAATHYGPLLLVGLVALAFFAGGIALYRRDPIAALLALWVFEVFDLPASSAIGSGGELIRQSDELLVLVFLILTVLRVLRSTIPLPPMRFLIPGIGFAVCGIVSGVLHGVPPFVTFAGGVLAMKLWIMIAITLILPWDRSHVDHAYRVLVVTGSVIAVLGIIDHFGHGVISHAFHIHSSVGYRSDADQSIFPTPGAFSLFMSLLFAISFSRFTNNGYRPGDLLFTLLFVVSVILSLRLKGFLSLTAVVAIVGVVQSASNPRRAIAGVLIGATLVLAGFQLEHSVISRQVNTYTSTEDSARSRLYIGGEEIASNSFPLGLGFGRYASDLSRTHYSPAYYEYGLSRVYGLSPQYSSFIEDTSWPSVFGETGYLGAAFFASGLLLLAWTALHRLLVWPANMRWLPLAGLCCIAVLVLDSLGDPALFTWLPVTTIAIVFGPLILLHPDREETVDRARERSSAHSDRQPRAVTAAE